MAKTKRRSELQLLNDRHNLAQLALTNPGASSAELSELYAHKYGEILKPGTIRYDLSRLKKQWVLETRNDMELVRVNELARTDALEQQAWQAWRASMNPMEKVVIERLHKAINEAARARMAGELASELAGKNEYINQEVVEAIVRDAIADSVDSGEDAQTFINRITTTTEERVGDPRYLAQIHEIQKERRKILGVYAPELHQLDVRKIELKGYAGGWSPDEWKSNDIIDGEFNNDEDAADAKQLLGAGSEEE